MGARRLLVLTAIGLLGAGGAAHADGVCVTVDVGRDNLTEPERTAVRIALLEALEREGVAVDRGGRRCQGLVSVYSIRLGKVVSTTLVAGERRVEGKASSIDEVDLLISQLARSLVTGRSLATGFGVTDRSNVLRDQTAPRRVDARSARRWDPIVAVGGGMLQLPPGNGRPRQRQYDIVAIEARSWGFLTSERSAIELLGRMVLHDYGVMEATYDEWTESRDRDEPGEELGWLLGTGVSPMAVANWEGGLGVVWLGGDGPPRPFFRAGASITLLSRFTDPDFYFDVGLGAYAGFGLQLGRHVQISVAANATNPVVHDWLDSGYWYFLTTTAMLEIRGEGKLQPGPRFLGPDDDPPPTIRRINE